MRYRFIWKFVIFLAAAGLLLAQRADRATLPGVVTDSTGRSIAGAVVKVHSDNTGVLTELTTNEAGAYSSPSLVLGAYTITVEQAGFKSAIHPGLRVVRAADFDNDGWPDIYVSCDSAPSLLYHNNHDGTFSEVGVAAGCAFDGNGAAMSGMGVGVADYDGDGWLDIVRANFSDQVTTLYHNNGDGTFQDASLQAGLGINTKHLGFGAGFFDFDNDGWKDIFLANGHVYSQLAGRKFHIGYEQPKVLYRNLGNGRFEDVSFRSGPGIVASRVSRGCAFGDLDNDGYIDILVNNLDAAPSLLRNDGATRKNALIVKCVGTRSNRSAIGARVKVLTGKHTQIDEVMSGSSYYSQNDPRLHFGLGASAKADIVEVLWPSGLKESFKDGTANQLLVITGTKGIVRREPFKPAR